MSETPDWYRSALGHLWLPYTQMRTAPPPLPVVASRGVRLTLADGRELVDGIASWWTACHGYNHPHIGQSVRAQLEVLPHVMLGGLVHEPAARLAARLAALLPGDLDHVFFCESGSVSVEIAMKMAVQYWMNGGTRGRTKFVSFRGGYHGDTFATMAVCDPDEGMHTLFQGVLAEQLVVDLPVDEARGARFDALLAAHRTEVAAVLVEPLVQGAGGMRMHDAGTLARIARACAAYDVLLIFDEIMTGFGRTGSMFACQEAGIVPDIITLSKALTGGTLPLAAAVARRHVFESFQDDDPLKALMHGPTYMGNALACAAANASLDLFESEPRLEQVAGIEAQLSEDLAVCRTLPGVADVRVRGAIGAVELERLDDIERLRRAFVSDGVWIRPLGRTMYLAPPFIIGADDLRTLTRAVVTRVRSGW
jgi:adenosylmethionine-8-amino-7-oxononanoate aminotransferase